MTSPPTIERQGPPDPDPGPVWRAFARRGLRNLLVCQGVAVAIWLMSSTRSLWALPAISVYSTAIGTLCWFFIDGSRILMAQWLQRHRPSTWPASARWPGAAWMLVCLVLGTALGYTLGSMIGDAVTDQHTPNLLHNRPAMLISLLAAVAATYYFYTNERLHLERAAAEAARRLATESQLRLLASQLEPHMLFNTLANLRVLIKLDAERAQTMLDHLIAYLRATLSASLSSSPSTASAGMHPLSAEFERLADYLALMAIRMGPRLQVQLDLPDNLRDQPVPPLLLQPLVENAIRHGLEPQVVGGRLHVTARAEGQHLVLSLRDTGVGLPEEAQASAAAVAASPGAPSRVMPTATPAGYGTAHVRERLAAAYGPRASFSLQAAPDAEGGTLAELRLPLSALPPLAGASHAARPTPSA